jgi:hypothetical protein
LTDGRLARRFTGPSGIARLVVVFCVAVTLAALAWRYPQAFVDANRTARANAVLDHVDRELGGGNSVLPTQSIAIEARGRIPSDESFEVSVGEPQEGWDELATPDALDTYMRYFLLPRRHADGAPWIICFACDRAAYPGAAVVWEGDEGVAIMRRPT